VSIHGLRRDVLQAQAQAAGLPVLEAPLPADCGNASYEAAFAEALAQARARWPGLAHVAFGDLFLDDVRAYREALCARLGWTPLFPLFGADTTRLAQDMVGAGLRATLCCVDTTQLGPEFAGREFDARLLRDLPAAVDPCGERGEFHTCVHAGPMFAAPLALRTGERVRRLQRFEYVDLLPAS
jgi:diphthamide synthase (EF-2-diphthine--ammonia ligase)